MSETAQYSILEVRDAHQALLTAEQHRLAGELDRAQDIYEQLLEQNPDYTAALIYLGLTHMARQDHAAAFPHLVRAAMLNPGDWSTLAELGSVYLELNAIECAVRCLERALILKPGQPNILYILGKARLQQANYPDAADLFERALENDPSHASAAIQLANCYVNLARFNDAAQTIDSALQMPLTYDQKVLAYFTLNAFPDLPANMDLLTAIDELDPAQPDNGGSAPSLIKFVRGTTFHKLGRHQEAWQCWVDINGQIADGIEQQRETYLAQGADLLEKAVNWTQPDTAAVSEGSDDPISLFILGPIHSGKRSLESLAASLDGVLAGHVDEIARNTACRVSQRAGLLTQDLLTNLPEELNDSIAQLYHSELKTAASDAKVLTITHPGATYDAGRLAQCVPNARFVFLKRNEDDMALCIFSQSYMPGTNQFAFDIPGIYEYISQYHQMIDNWLEKLGNRAIAVRYEEMVEDPESTLASVAEFCRLKLPSKFNRKIDDDRGRAEPYRNWLHAARDEAKAP